MKPKIILSAGMYRSASTLQFNILRVILEQSGESVYSCFEAEYEEGDERSIHLIKTHSFNINLIQKSSFIFTSIRDRQGITNSIKRINEWDSTLDPNKVDAYLEQWLNLATMANFIQSYQMINNIPMLISIYGKILGIEVSIPNILNQLEKEMVDPGEDQVHHHPKTLLHHKHRA